MTGKEKDGSLSVNAIICAILLLVLTAVTYRDICMTRTDDNWAALTQAAHGVLEGRPHWRAYQNRLLGPVLTGFLSVFTGDYASALKLFVALSIGAQIVLLFALLRTAGPNRTQSMLWVVCWAFFFTSIQHFWLYTWDFLDILVFTFLSFCLFFNRWIGASFLLYFVAIINRESALFIPCGLILLEFFKHWKAGPLAFLANRRVWIYGAAAVLGLVYIKLIRDWLFVEAVFGGADVDHEMFGNHFALWVNLTDLYSNIVSFDIAYTLPVFLACAGALFLLTKCPDAGVKAGAGVFLLYFANILVFGLFNETRMLFPLFSFIVFGIVRYQELTGTGDITLHYRVVTSPKLPA